MSMKSFMSVLVTSAAVLSPVSAFRRPRPEDDGLLAPIFVEAQEKGVGGTWKAGYHPIPYRTFSYYEADEKETDVATQETTETDVATQETTVFYQRHGESTGNAARVWRAGDGYLTATGVGQAVDMIDTFTINQVKELSESNFFMVSPSCRAMQTLAIGMLKVYLELKENNELLGEMNVENIQVNSHLREKVKSDSDIPGASNWHQAETCIKDAVEGNFDTWNKVTSVPSAVAFSAKIKAARQDKTKYPGFETFANTIKNKMVTSYKAMQVASEEEENGAQNYHILEFVHNTGRGAFEGAGFARQCKAFEGDLAEKIFERQPDSQTAIKIWIVAHSGLGRFLLEKQFPPLENPIEAGARKIGSLSNCAFVKVHFNAKKKQFSAIVTDNFNLAKHGGMEREKAIEATAQNYQDKCKGCMFQFNGEKFKYLPIWDTRDRKLEDCDFNTFLAITPEHPKVRPDGGSKMVVVLKVANPDYVAAPPTFYVTVMKEFGTGFVDNFKEKTTKKGLKKMFTKLDQKTGWRESSHYTFDREKCDRDNKKVCKGTKNELVVNQIDFKDAGNTVVANCWMTADEFNKLKTFMKGAVKLAPPAPEVAPVHL